MRTSSRRYLALLAAGFVGATAIIAALNVFGFRTGLVDPPQQRALAYVEARMADRAAVDMVFVGDSSLGRTIDEAAFAEATGLTARSYPLTAAFGYAGTYNALRQAIAAHHPKVVVIVQTPRVAAKPQSSLAGYVLASKGLPNDAGLWPVARTYLSLPNAEKAALNAPGWLWRRLRQGPEPAPTTTPVEPARPLSVMIDSLDDLAALSPAQRARKQFLLGGEPEHRLAFVADAAALGFMDRMARHCRAAGVRCYWAHGPLYEEQCRLSQPLIARLGREAAARGLPVVHAQPYCIPLAEVDDSAAHADPRLRPKITRVYVDWLRTAGALPAPKG